MLNLAKNSNLKKSSSKRPLYLLTQSKKSIQNQDRAEVFIPDLQVLLRYRISLVFQLGPPSPFPYMLQNQPHQSPDMIMHNVLKL